MENVIGKNLRFYRKRSHYSLEEVSEVMNLSIDQILKFENSEFVPTINELIKFSKLYNVTLDNLVKEDHKNIHRNSVYVKVNEGVKFSSNKKLKVTRKYSRVNFLSSEVLIITLFLITIIYLSLGFAFPNENIWNVYWVLYLIPFILYSLIETIVKRNLYLFNISFLMTFIYLLHGMILNIWHPTWIMFLFIPLYYFITDALRNYSLWLKEEFIKN